MGSRVEQLLKKIENRKGFIYHFAYGWTTKRRRDRIYQTNACRLFWRCIFSIPLWPLWIIVTALLYVGMFLVLGLLSLVGLPFGHRPSWLKDDDTEMTFVRYRRWPTIRGRRILPIYLILIGGVLWGFYHSDAWLLPVVGWIANLIVSFFTWSPSYFVLLSAAVVLVIFSLVRKFLKSETWEFIRTYFKEWKGERCPVIRFKSSWG